MEQTNQQLEMRIAELEKQLQQLQNGSTIPYNIDNSFMARGFLKTSVPETPPGEWYLNEGFVAPTTPEAQAVAVQYLKVLNTEGKNYWIALYTFSELA